MVVKFLITVSVLRQELVVIFLYLRKCTENILEYKLFNGTLADRVSRNFNSCVAFVFAFSCRFRQP